MAKNCQISVLSLPPDLEFVPVVVLERVLPQVPHLEWQGIRGGGGSRGSGRCGLVIVFRLLATHGYPGEKDTEKDFLLLPE